MKHEKLKDALSELQDRHVDEAVRYKKRSYLPWVSAVAAVLAVAILASTLLRPKNPGSNTTLFSDNPQASGDPLPSTALPPDEDNTTAPSAPGHEEEVRPPDAPNHDIYLSHLVAKPIYPTMAIRPEIVEDGDYDAWYADQLAMHTQPEGYADSLQDFWEELNQAILADNGGSNVTCSPVNIYLALAMLAETTGGESQQQILEALGADSIQSLRTQAKQVWQGHYNNDGPSTSVLANSLWLEENYGFNMDTINLIAENYYASVFQGDVGSEEMTQALKAWLNEQTGGLLEEQIGNLVLDPDSVLALASTIYYKVQWAGWFIEEKNAEDTFHGVKGDTTETFMNKTLSSGSYYWDEHFGATSLSLQDGSRMWLFLPDEGFAPEDIVKDVHSFLQGDPDRSVNQRILQINLSLPKFDISADLDLKDTLKQMGITDVFDSMKADFSPLLTWDDKGVISDARHAARVTINEKGVTAAAYTLILRDPTSAPPAGNEMDFVLDRPFMFYIESEDGLPLFTGIVNEP